MRISVIATLVASMFMSLDAYAADLLQVYKEALANDPVYAGARAARNAGDEKAPQGLAGLLPTVAVSGSYLRNHQDVTQGGFNASFPYVTNGYVVSLSQPLLRWANWEQYQEGKLSAAASETQFAQAQQDLIVRVGQAYFDVLTAQDTLDSVQAQKTAITEQLASAKRNFEVGTATITDTHEAQARYDLTVAQEFAAQNDLEIKRAALQQIIGKSPAILATLRTGVKLAAPVPAQIDKWVDSAEQQNYSVLGQQFALEIAQREIKRNRAGHTPTLDLVASRTHGNQFGSNATNPSGLSNINSIGVQWTIPIFSGFGVTSKVREAIALEDKARSDLENARRTAAQGARQSYLGVTSGLAQVNALEAAEISSQSALDSNRLGYQVGVRINIDVLNAQQQLYSTRSQLAKARYDTIMNGLRLKSAAGTLKEEDLAQVNSLLTYAPEIVIAHVPQPQPEARAMDGKTGAIADAAGPQRDAVLAAVSAWAKAWSAQDTAAYLGFYGSDFVTPHGEPRAAWEKQRTARIKGKAHVEVDVVAPRITLNGDTAMVAFDQRYTSDRLKSTSRKTLTLRLQNEKWLIVKEQDKR